MSPFFSSLRIRLLLIVFLAVLPAFGVIIYSSLEQREFAKTIITRDILSKVSTIARYQERLFEDAEKEMSILAEFPSIKTQAGTCSGLLTNLIKKNSEYLNLGVADRSGKVLCSALPLEKAISLADRTYFQQAIKTRQFTVGSYQVGRISRKVTIALGYPILDTDGNVKGAVFAGLDLDWLQNLVENAADKFSGTQATITVVDKSGTVLARWPEGEQWVGLPKPDVNIIETVLKLGHGTTESRGLDGVSKLYAFSPLGRRVGYVYVGIPTANLYAKVNQTLIRNLVFLGLALALALAAAWFLSSQLVMHRLGFLVDAVKRISAGDISARTGLVYGRGEIDNLAQGFDEMASELQAHEEEWQFTNRILIIANQASTIEQLIKGLVAEIKNYTRCAAVGIRVLGGDGVIPYLAFDGFSRQFYELESPLSVKSGQCMCLNVIKGTTDPGLPFYTQGGSFYINFATRFLATVSPEDRGNVWNACKEFGYESVAFIPLRVGNDILGLIYLADFKEDMVPLRRVEELEKVGMRLAQALKRLQAEENIRALSHALMQAQEQERQKISRELHDSVAQELAASKISLENLQGDLQLKPVPELSRRVTKISERLQETLNSIRNLSYDLRPPDLEHFGLVQAIKLHCEEFAALAGLNIDFKTAGMEAGHLDYDVAINLYRIIQEGLNNVWRHAQAANVRVRLIASYPKAILRIEDDGQGFDVSSQAASTTRGKHMGLLGMRERVSLLRGEISIKSQLKKGTQIIVEIPWNGEGLDSKEEAHNC